jgi:hypothetical protein
MAETHALAIGVDGGASGVRALAVRRRPDGLLEPAGALARREHEPFGALELALQRAQLAAPRRDESERSAARARVAAAADAIVEAAAGARRVVVGVCWPGLKTRGGRGVALAQNGPRDVALLDELERALAARGIELARPTPPLANDGVAGALGECWSHAGALRGAREALYCAGGTGLAEAVLIAGRVRALDALEVPLPKAWELEFRAADGRTERLDDALAPGRWSLRGVDAGPDAEGGASRARIDWLDVLRRDRPRGSVQLKVVAAGLVRYIEDRMRRLRESSDGVPERLVVGARLGRMLEHRDAFGSQSDVIADALIRAGIPADFVRASTSIEAPAIGTAAIALGLEDAPCPS